MVLYSTIVFLAAAFEITAEQWHNVETIRLHDTRDVLLVFLDARALDKRDLVRNLNRLDAQKKFRVIGLFREDPREVDRLVRRWNLKFALGSGCRTTFEKKRIRRPPEFLLITKEQERPWELKDVNAAIAPWTDDVLQGRVSGVSSTDELESIIESDLPGMVRARALWKLAETYGGVDSEEFTRHASALLESETNPWVVGHVRSALVMSRGGDTAIDDGPAPSTLALGEFERDDAQEKFADARSVGANAEKASPAELLGHFRQHNVNDEPGALVVRRLVVDELSERKLDAAARSALLEIVSSEPDRSIRLRAVGGLGDICRAGSDVEAADFLTELAAMEPSIRHVRPMMEYVAFYLRTGVEDSAQMKKADLAETGAP